jgi:tetratricopeptide (TPR) repeat protein
MKRFGFTLSLLLVCLGAAAQTLQQGRNYFAQGDYERAKPIMLKYLKQSPDNASRNYWYGVCCIETGEPDIAVPYLEKAAEKKYLKHTDISVTITKDARITNRPYRHLRVTWKGFLRTKSCMTLKSNPVTQR